MSKLRAPSRSVEVFIVDAQGAAAAQALESHRPTAESTHVLCRHRGESFAAFRERVQSRIERIRACRRIRSLWYVAALERVTSGDPAGAETGESPLPLLDTLVSMLETGASLTVIGPGTHQDAVFAWLDSLIPQQRSRVTVSAQLYPHPAVAAPGVPPRRAPPRSSPVACGPSALRALTRDPEVPLAESA